VGKKVSLRKRLTWYVVTTLLLMAVISGIAIRQGTDHETEEIFSASLVQTARILDGLINLESIENNRKQLKLALERDSRAHKYERKLFFAVFTSDGKLILHSFRSPEIPHKVIESGFSEFKFKGKTWNTFSLLSSSDNLRIVVGERTEFREEINEYVGGGLLLPLIFLLPFVLWLLWHIVGVALKPLQAVTDQVKQQDLRQLKTINVEGVPTEISPLVESLNQMIVDLDAAYARERRFVSDASHELRNPLASLLINVDNAIEESLSTESIESLQSMKTSIKRLSHLVSQLLQLSHYENPLDNREFEEIDFGRLCKSVVDSLQDDAKANQIQLDLKLPAQPCHLSGLESLLISLLTNLIDNAIRYCNSGCRVLVRCERSESGLTLVVEDSGPGLDEASREKVMQRFYRMEDSAANGAGLGLSIVKAISDIHRAELKLDSSVLGGLAVSIQFKKITDSIS
jgi:two-component system sensor histidine kinase QseC